MDSIKTMLRQFVPFLTIAIICIVAVSAADLAYLSYRWCAQRIGKFIESTYRKNTDDSFEILEQKGGKILHHHCTADGKRTVKIIADSSDIPIKSKVSTQAKAIKGYN